MQLRLGMTVYDHTLRVPPVLVITILYDLEMEVPEYDHTQCGAWIENLTHQKEIASLGIGHSRRTAGTRVCFSGT